MSYPFLKEKNKMVSIMRNPVKQKVPAIIGLKIW